MNADQPITQPSTSKSTVLIVDDEPMSLTVLNDLLKPQYAMRVANSGERALTMLATESLPDLILLDVMMPGMSGFQTLERIKALPQTSELPVIFITMLNDEDSEQRGLELGASDYVHKPIKGPIVLSRVRAQIDAKSARDLLRKNNLLLNAQVIQGARALEQTQAQLLQLDKMAALGQLAAGIAHEINNPISFVSSNLGTLEKYITRLLQALDARVACLPVNEGTATDEREIDFIREDLPNLLQESRDGVARVRKIVKDLKDFSRVDEKPDWQYADLNECIESTLNIVNNELKYKADVETVYGELPQVQCIAPQLSQVVLNLLVNASQSIADKRGRITVRTGGQADGVWFEVSDTGSGISPEVLERIFEPFYTTKPVGKGTGLGLSISYGIVQKHHGTIDVTTAVGRGTTIRVNLPTQQP
jgi:two-component system NtrC family sensor kinase